MTETIEIHASEKDGLLLTLDNRELLRHCAESPALFAGHGKERIGMYRGNFDIEDRVEERFALRLSRVDSDLLTFTHPDMGGKLTLRIIREGAFLKLRGSCSDSSINRLWIRLSAWKGEHVTGGGEQFSALDLRGKIYPIWTREQGVGRNKLTEITRLADANDHAGGDYYTTFFPQPTFVSSRLYWAHLENYEYSELDFRAENFHEIGVWATSFSLVFSAGDSYRELSRTLSALLGRQPVLPDWAMKGIWLGVQGGTEKTLELLNRCRNGGMDVSAVWIQDWEGRRITSFGKRLQWDWRWNKDTYPNLDKVIASDPNTRWMGYINPYLVEGGVLFAEAQSSGYFVKKQNGEDYLFDFGEYDCGVVDLTMPAAYEWYKNVIKTNLIGLGFRGWMADFGEYLPADSVCFGGSGLEMHNKWPMLWAKCNRDAVEESGLLGECVFFMRAGAAGSQSYSTLLWAGDQNVDWSDDDGLPSVITAALTAGMSGFGLHTCDAGGYTTLYGMRRDEELLLRWLEFACFTPVIRTHEGNRPDDNVQLYSSSEIIASAARLSHIHTALLPYLKSCVEENAADGIPVMRPLFYNAPESDRAYERDLYSYYLGDELLVAPVVAPGESARSVWIPEGEWIHLWSGESYAAGEVNVDAPLGKPPVFYRKNGKFEPLFRALADII
jgi:sulfoquinovosidase